MVGADGLVFYHPTHPMMPRTLLVSFSPKLHAYPLVFIVVLFANSNVANECVLVDLRDSPDRYHSISE